MVQKILRKAYSVQRKRRVIRDKRGHTYVRKPGTTFVRARMIIKRGDSDRKTRLPKPKAGLLPGYHYPMPVAARHAVLVKALHNKKESSLALGRHLLLLSTLTRATIPRASRVYKKNSAWMFKLKI